MKISPYSASTFAPCVTGDGHPPYRKGKLLVQLFNEFGMEDYYDPEIGLPRLGKADHNTTRTDYAVDRMMRLDPTQTLAFLDHVLNNAEDKESAVQLFNTAFKRLGVIASEVSGVIQITGDIVANTETTASSAHFRLIEQKVIRAIDEAKVMIWVAMAWFTNDAIYQKLLEKQNEGVDIKLLIFRDGVNQTHGVDLTPFDHKRIRGTRGGIMHNKFCVIDNQFVITGSFNWSTNAETRNDENVIELRDISRATEYSLEFKRLWNES